MTSDPQAKADKFSWQPNAKILLFTLLMLPLLVALGYWQLDRAQEKRQILADSSRPAGKAHGLCRAVVCHGRGFGADDSCGKFKSITMVETEKRVQT